MAVLTLETALPQERKSYRRGPLAWFLGLLLILMIGSSTMLAHRNSDAAIQLDAAAVAVGPGGELTQVSGADALVPGSRVLSGMPDSVDLAGEQAAWSRQEPCRGSAASAATWWQLHSWTCTS